MDGGPRELRLTLRTDEGKLLFLQPHKINGLFMFRVAYVLLTVAGISACPFMCMAKVGDHGASAEQRAGCPCCQHRRQDPTGEGQSDNSPVKPERDGPSPIEDCDCTCLCKGALHAEGVFKFNLEEQTAGNVWLDFSLGARADAGFQSLPWFAEAPPPPKLGSGRLIRLAFASLLL